jgi:hypothetical protein
MKIHEYQGKELLRQFNVPTPRGIVAKTAEEAEQAARDLGTDVVVVKAQIHAGGRGKGGGVKLAKLPKTVVGKDARIRVRLAIGCLILVVAGCFGCKGDVTSPTPKSNTADEKSDNRNSDKSLSNDNLSAKDNKKSDDATGEIPSDNVLQEMVKTTILEFNEAVQRADFKDFYENMGTVKQKETSPAKLKDFYRQFIDKKINLDSIRGMTANFLSTPKITNGNGYRELVLEGRYPTSPNRTSFSLAYTPENGKWKLSGFYVDTSQ